MECISVVDEWDLVIDAIDYDLNVVHLMVGVRHKFNCCRVVGQVTNPVVVYRSDPLILG